jgi:DNA-cytosine methyltransferase
MSELLDLLAGAVEARSHDSQVALLLSGGLDSLSVGLALERAGKRPHAYTFHLQDYQSRDIKNARAIAAHFRWPLTVITVPTTEVRDDFLRLAVDQGCRTKAQFEVTFPLLYVLPEIEETEVWTGWNADEHFGNTRECIFRQRRRAHQPRSERKQAFDEERRAYFKEALVDPNSGLRWWYAHRLAQHHRKLLLDPYTDDAIYDYFLRFDHELVSPLRKPLVRQALADELRRLPNRSIAVGVRLQTGGGVSSLFSTLLQNEAINRFEKKYTTVSALCQRWGREISRNRACYLMRARALPPRQAAAKLSLIPAVYSPHRMEDVWASSGHGFTAVEMFAGGGGSALGLHQAGYNVVLVNEFVPEAARTYRANFPHVVLDPRDIREITVSHTTIETFLRLAGLRRGDCRLLAGSFPCCEFSTIGKGLSDQSRPRVYSDTKQRGVSTLIFEFVKLARMTMPEAAVAENVPDLGTTYRALLDGALDILRFTAEHRERVYFANFAVLSADDYGTPEARRRLFIIAVRRDVADAVGIKSDADLSGIFPPPTHLPVSVRSALTSLQQTYGQLRPWRAAVAASSTLRYLVSRLPPDPIDWLRLRHVGLSEKSWFSLVRSAWDKPAPTLAVLGQLPNGLGGVIHPEQNRKFTLPELKRLTGLPDDFVLTGTLEQAVERVCRMVPPALMRAVAGRIYDKVLRPYHEQLR